MLAVSSSTSDSGTVMLNGSGTSTEADAVGVAVTVAVAVAVAAEAGRSSALSSGCACLVCDEAVGLPALTSCATASTTASTCWVRCGDCFISHLTYLIPY